MYTVDIKHTQSEEKTSLVTQQMEYYSDKLIKCLTVMLHLEDLELGLETKLLNGKTLYLLHSLYQKLQSDDFIINTVFAYILCIKNYRVMTSS
jgi:hypothetical protein